MIFVHLLGYFQRPRKSCAFIANSRTQSHMLTSCGRAALLLWYSCHRGSRQEPTRHSDTSARAHVIQHSCSQNGGIRADQENIPGAIAGLLDRPFVELYLNVQNKSASWHFHLPSLCDLACNVMRNGNYGG